MVLGSSCSFKSSTNGSNEVEKSLYEKLRPQDLAKMDTDGDRVNDLEEREKGLNPFVANIPEMKVRFLQNYSIKIQGIRQNSDGTPRPDSNWDFTIDTRVGRNDPDFKYRVGEILVRNKAYEEAARIGKFSSHSWGEIKESDLTRVSYPEVDNKFTNHYSLLAGKYFSDPTYLVNTLTIELESSAKLLNSSVYNSVKNLELNFYYYSYETESYELLATKTIGRNFSREVNETFSVTLENVPTALISDNYLKKGEFIISEVKDFEIPEIGIKYSELMKSVKSKTIEMVLNNPLETKALFVAPFKSKDRFIDLMENAFSKQFKIEEDNLIKVEQFENNLSDYTNLLEVRSENKKGKWFVFTPQMARSYLDHEFKAGQAIVLSYITGNILSEQTSEKINALRYNISGDEDYKIYPLGNVSPNTVIDFVLSPGMRYGEKMDRIDDHPSMPGGSCGRNCVSREFSCHLSTNLFKSRNEGYVFNKDLSEEISMLSLIINEDEFSLKELVNEKKVDIYWQEGLPHFRINNILNIKEIIEAEENVISLKIKTFSDTTWNGINLISSSGRDYYTCYELVGAAAFNNKWPVYEGSSDFPKWRHLYNWSVLTLGHNRSYKQPFTLDVSSTVHNYHN